MLKPPSRATESFSTMLLPGKGLLQRLCALMAAGKDDDEEGLVQLEPVKVLEGHV